jgi:DNA topoisomerase-1
VQSVAVRLVVEREREIDAFVPDERWEMSTGCFALGDEGEASKLGPAWREFLATPPEVDEKRPGEAHGPDVKKQNAWLSEHRRSGPSWSRSAARSSTSRRPAAGGRGAAPT